jgi:hypothetical protein
MTLLRSWLTVLMVALGAAATAGCDGFDDRGSLPLSTVEPAPVTTITPTDSSRPPDPPADAGTPTPTPGNGSYETMCRNYCGALEQTLVYACIGRGQGDEASCAARHAGTEVQCWQGRCAAGQVQQSLCFTQCDSLAAAYAAACGANGENATDLFVCATPPAAHDAACRAGCVLDPTLAP